MKTILATIALVLVTTLSFAGTSREVILVIVNKENAASRLTRDDLRPIYLTTKLQWPDGKHIAAYDFPDGDATRNGFNAAVLGLDPDRVARYWIDRKIRGGERPPPKLPTASAAIAAVTRNPGAVAYVLSTELGAADVKVVAKIQGGEVFAP